MYGTQLNQPFPKKMPGSTKIDSDYSVSTEWRPSTLFELLRMRALKQPEHPAYTFLQDGETDELTLTYAELDRKARTAAALLQSVGAEGERVLLLYPPGLEYIAAFWGCLYAGATAVPAYPPRLNRKLTRLETIAADAQAKIVFTTSAILSKAESLFTQAPCLKAMRWMATDDVADLSDNWREPAVSNDALAFLQYTSGSTSAPKGVMVSHGNLLHNERMIQDAFRQNAESVIVGWLPLYHDMGLIGNVLQPLYLGARCILMSPLAFLQRPFRWLDAISRYRATTSGGPNFAYELCIRKINEEQRELLDLSSWRVAFNGSEPVRHTTLEQFAEAFKRCGFRREAFQPCYGLAEATLLVSGKHKADLPAVKKFQSKLLEAGRVREASTQDENRRTLVSNGCPLPEQKVLIVDPELSTECLPDEIGEVWVSGSSVARGYWNNPEQTEDTFKAFLSGGDGQPFLRTGDTGFLYDDELFITGRLKDLIIIRGRNHHPQDIEFTVERCHTALRPGSGAAFSVEVDGEERLVIVYEVKLPHKVDVKQVVEIIREAVSQEHEIEVHAVALISTGSIPKTSSGKIQRHACREQFLAGALRVVGEWRSPKDVDGDSLSFGAAPLHGNVETIINWLAAQLAGRFGVDVSEIDINRPLVSYGLDSLMAIELTHSIEAGLGMTLPVVSLLESPSISEFAAKAMAQVAATPSITEPIPAGSERSINGHPLSYGQQSLWFLHQMAPQSAAYNIASAVRIRSTLNAPALRRAFQSLVDRHASLRTAFIAVEGQPVQHVYEQLELSVQEIEASDWDEATLNQCLVTEAHRPFDLEQPPLLRVSLFRRAAEERILLFVIHHIVADFWSLTVLINELGILYLAEKTGTAVSLSPVSFQYTDYVRWQSEMLKSAGGERLWNYWKQQLAGELPFLNLATDRPRPAIQTFRGASYPFTLNAELTQGIKAVGQSHNATLFVTLLAVYQVLLHRYTGQDEIIVGTPTACRSWAELAAGVGYFVNPVALRANLAGNLTFETFLAQVRQTVLSAFEHQDYPFTLLVERLEPERDASRSPIFQTMFVLQKPHLLHEGGLASFALGESGARIELGGLSLESMSLEQRVAQFDLTLMMAETADGLAASIEYNTDLFDHSTIARLARHFHSLLASILSHHTHLLSQLPLLSSPERLQLLVEWNQTERPSPPLACLHHLFEAQADRTPSALALSCGDEHLTYRELEMRANQLARQLRRAGVRAEVVVAIMLERGVELVVALLGVLKAGGAYLPLDATYPPERLAFMLEDAGVEMVLTEQRWMERLSAGRRGVIALDRQWGERARESEQRVEGAVVEGENLAYVIYTSGSTGLPKGVAIEHRSVVALLHWANTTFTSEQLAGVLASTSICFDLSVFELFAPLTSGGTVILVESILHLSGMDSDADVRLINTVPSAMAELLRFGGVPASVSTVNLAGEPLQGALVQQVYQQTNAVEVWNLYGPSEDTTYSTCALIAQGSTQPPSIGRPIANSQVYLLDAHLQPVPVGIAGELYLGGNGLARGYFARPGLTAERFIPNPFGDRPGARLYKTGDLARYLSDGSIEYLGRVDHQVKLRGFRIELGEIEAVLMTHEHVRDAVVTVREDEAGNKNLVAYLVPNGSATFDLVELRSWLAARLPEYMIPYAFVTLSELPLTPNGKIDRRALPAPDAARPDLPDAFVAPRTFLEEMLAGMWAQLLGLDKVGVQDNFFSLGGHSLLAVQVISRIREYFAVELPLRSLFETPTIGLLARRIEALRKEGGALSAPPLLPAPRDEHLPLSFAQQRLWFLNQLAPGSTTYNLQAGVRLNGSLDVAAVERALNEISMRHEALRTIFRVIDGRPIQIVIPAQAMNLSFRDISHLVAAERETEVLESAAEEARYYFELAQAPLCRCRLLRLADEEHVLLLTMSHLISDGYSMSVLMREFAALYQAFSDGTASTLAPLPLQYGDFAYWQRRWLQGQVLQSEMDYWKRQLGGNLTSLELKTDRPRPPVQSFRGAQRYFSFDDELSRSLKAFSRRQGVTLYMTLLAGFQVLLYHYTGQDDIVVGTDVANRNHIELEHMIGLFTNQLVLRTDLSGNPTFSELLTRTREVALGAFAHQNLPFEKLVEELQPERDLSRNPLFQCMFIFQTDPARALALPGLTLRRLELAEETSAFDLSLSILETEGGTIKGALRYSTDLFEPETVSRMLSRYEMVLRNVLEGVDRRLSALEIHTAMEKEQQAAESKERKESKLKKLMSVRPKPLVLSEKSLLKMDYLTPDRTLPLVMRPDVDDIDLTAWAEAHREQIEQHLRKHGAILFRNLDAASVEKFEHFVKIISPETLEYGERSSPRTKLSGRIYTSTDHPSDQHILLHNEQSYTLNWPMKIWFCCIQAASEGGRTPMADSRKVFHALSPTITGKFMEKQVMYVRNYGDGLGLPWQEVFQTTDKSKVEEHCRRASIGLEWKDGDRLRTRQIRPAVRRHPKTNELTWFNHALFFNVSGLEGPALQALMSLTDKMELPSHTFYGDGSPIEASVLDEIREAYRREQVAFSWQEGDILMLDNMLVAHGREPFTGPRKIVVAMSEPFGESSPVLSGD
jgi:amino acid adenylation domain-containing protein